MCFSTLATLKMGRLQLPAFTSQILGSEVQKHEPSQGWEHRSKAIIGELGSKCMRQLWDRQLHPHWSINPSRCQVSRNWPVTSIFIAPWLSLWPSWITETPFNPCPLWMIPVSLALSRPVPIVKKSILRKVCNLMGLDRLTNSVEKNAVIGRMGVIRFRGI